MYFPNAFKISCSFQVKQFYFFDAGDIPPPVIMVQHVSFRYSDDTVGVHIRL